MNEQITRAPEAVTAERADDVVLSVRGLTVRFRLRGRRQVAAVTDASFDLAAGECLALVGESGCGKSVLASALLGLLPGNARTAGTALLSDAPARTEPAGTEPAGTEPAGTEPAGTEPAGTEPAGTEPDWTEPDRTEPDRPPAGVRAFAGVDACTGADRPAVGAGASTGAETPIRSRASTGADRPATGAGVSRGPERRRTGAETSTCADLAPAGAGASTGAETPIRSRASTGADLPPARADASTGAETSTRSTGAATPIRSRASIEADLPSIEADLPATGAGRAGGRDRAGGGAGRPPALDLLAADERTLARTVRGRRVGLVPQSPAAHLTPVRTVRAHLEETVRALTRTPRRERRAAAEAAAARAAFPADHLDRHPHELSGGLAQRAATALALVGDAPLLLADEPTTGLDRELVDRTADELRRHADRGKALLLITHDLAAARRVADRVAVMYAGRIVELTSAARFFGAAGPRHPYARGLLDALPEREFRPVPGLPPELSDLPEGCAFAPRCPRASAACAVRPEFAAGVACHHPLGAPRA